MDALRLDTNTRLLVLTGALILTLAVWWGSEHLL